MNKNKEIIYEENNNEKENLLKENGEPDFDLWVNRGPGLEENVIHSYYSKEQISKFSHLCDNWEFFTDSLINAVNIGYTDLNENYNSFGKSKGLCEYISISSVLSWWKTTKNENFIWDKDVDKYFTKPYNKNSINHIYYKSSANPENGKKALAYEIWKNGGKKTDIKFREEMATVLKKWIPAQTYKKLKFKSCVSWGHTSSPETWLKDYKVPILFSFYESGVAHNVVIYGYNQSTNEYAVHYGFGEDQSYRKPYSRAIMKKSKMWYYTSMGFYYAMRLK